MDDKQLSSLDLTNLNFLLKSDEQTLQEFYDSASDDDLSYALELIRYAIVENMENMERLVEEVALDSKQDPYADANAVLSKFRLK